jgi:hypothetical protein
MGDAWAPVIVFVTGILTTGAVLILRPISVRLGALMEAMTERQRAALAARAGADPRAADRDRRPAFDPRGAAGLR